jgi:ribose transport system permease protein
MGGAFIGLMLLNTFTNGLVVIGLGSYWQIVAKGLLLIFALVLDFFRERARIRALKASAAAQA